VVNFDKQVRVVGISADGVARVGRQLVQERRAGQIPADCRGSAENGQVGAGPAVARVGGDRRRGRLALVDKDLVDGDQAGVWQQHLPFVDVALGGGVVGEAEELAVAGGGRVVGKDYAGDSQVQNGAAVVVAGGGSVESDDLGRA